MLPPEPPATPDLAFLASRLKAVANERRLRLLDFLKQPRYIEEVATELGVARQSAQEHLDLLVSTGLAMRVAGRRDSGAVIEYVVSAPELFRLQEEMRALAAETPRSADRQPTESLGEDGREGPDHGPRLVVLHGRPQGLSRPLAGPGPWGIGREAAAHVYLDYDPFVSLRHAEVRRVGAGFELVDIYSRNGTFLDWTRLPRGAGARLENGAIVGVGRSLLIFRTTPDARHDDKE